MNLLLEEIRGILPGATRLRVQALLVLAFIWIVFGVVLPLRKGLEFFDPMILTAYASLGCVFAIPVVVRTLREVTLPRILARAAAAAVYGEFMALGLVGLGIYSVYWSHRGRLYFPPAWGAVAEEAMFGASLTLAAAIAGSWLTLALTDAAAKFLLRIVLLAALVAFLFQGRALPDVLRTATGFALALAALFFILLRREIRRRTG